MTAAIATEDTKVVCSMNAANRVTLASLSLTLFRPS